MMELDDDDLALAVMALRYVADSTCAQSSDNTMGSGCTRASKACIDGYCLPKMRGLIDRIQKHRVDKKNAG